MLVEQKPQSSFWMLAAEALPRNARTEMILEERRKEEEALRQKLEQVSSTRI
jgi:hypothetical protein